MLKLSLSSVFIVLIAITSINAVKNPEDLEEWYRNVQDPSYDCGKTGQHKKSNAEQILNVVPCDSPGARYDYNYKPGDGKKPKRGPFKGPGTVTFSKNHDNGKFNHGFKFGKCLKAFNETVMKISGVFDNDKLQGQVRLEYKDNTFSVGTAIDNVLVGYKRHWSDESHHLVNITDAVTDEVILSKDATYGVFKTRLADSGRIMVTKDFSRIYNCVELDKEFMIDCFTLDDTDLANVNIEGCKIDMDVQALAKIATADRDKFKFSLKHDEIKSYKEIDAKIPCDEQEWNRDSIRHSIEDWLESVDNGDLLWYLDGDQEPLDPANPTIDIFLDHYHNRAGFDRVTVVKIETAGGEELWKGTMFNGHIQGKVAIDKVNHPGWKTRLQIILGGDGSEVPILSQIGSHMSLDKYEHYLSGSLRRGKLHGIVQKFGVLANDPEGHCASTVLPGLAYVGRYVDGKPVGHAWRGLTGGSWLYGEVDSNGDFTGNGNVAFLYPDFETAFVGEFKKGLMVNGREATVVGEKCDEYGIKMLQFSDPTGPVFHYEEPTNETLGDQPHLRDPLDKKYVYLKDSVRFPIAGEATYAKRDVPPNTVFVLYGGRLLTEYQDTIFRQRMDKLIEEKGHRDHPDVIAMWKYKHTLGNCQMKIDIPPEFEPTSNFQGTLGHKVNHAFDPTCQYIQMDTPRFGIINAVRTKEPIKKDEEYFANYGYAVLSGPKWHRDLYRQFAKDNPQMVPAINIEKLDEYEAELAKGRDSLEGQTATIGEEEEIAKNTIKEKSNQPK